MKRKCNVDPSCIRCDGSVDIECLNKLSLGKFMEIFPELSQEQVDEYWAKTPNSTGPIKPIKIDKKFEKDLVEKHTYYRKFRHEEKATAIADFYMDKHPRSEYVLVNLCSTTEASEDGYYKEITNEEKNFIKNWTECTSPTISLDEYIASQNPKLYQRLVSNPSLYALDMIDSIDLNDARKYSQCQIREYEQETDNYRVYNSSFPLNDDEFRELLIDRISTYRSLTMNSVVVYHPDLAQKIMKHLLCLTGLESENFNHFMVIFTEIDNAFNEIIKTEEDLPMELQNYLGFRNILG